MDRSTKWSLVSPEGVVQPKGEPVNPHPGDLNGKTILLYWNGKPNGDIFLHRVAELLSKNFSTTKIIKAWETVPSSKHTDSNYDASRLTASKLADLHPDIVIGAQGDCAGSATWLIIDQLNLEKTGIPTVTVLTSPFEELANTVPIAEGYKEACFVIVPPPIGMLPASDVRDKADNVFKHILQALTSWQPSPVQPSSVKCYPSARFEFEGSIEDLNRYFFEHHFALGLPIIPPTTNLVDRMLDGIGREPGEVLGQVPPKMGTLTVELAAVHGVMAGCKSEYMPALIAALEGFLDKQANLRMALSGTGTSQLVVIYNGPIVKEIGIGYGQGAAGKGYHPNAAIGYAINLIAYTIGGSRPPAIDRSTLASPSDYVCWVFGENEDALPSGWDPLHVERGFEKTDSAVTVMCSYPPVENVDHWSATVQEHVRWWGRTASPLLNMGGPCFPEVMEQNPIIALGPEHAALIASAEWSKDDFRSNFWENTRIPINTWPDACGWDKLEQKYGHVNTGSKIPLTIKHDQLLVIIAGGDGKQSHYFAPFPGSFPVSRPIKK